MTKRCICEICTCGRHRCPHRSTNHLNQGNGECKLTEYTNVYKPHPLGPRENFKPNQAPMHGGEFHGDTTQRHDFKPHQLERPYVHKHEQYVKPQGDMATGTSYTAEYVEKFAPRAQAIRHDGQRQVAGKFEGEPTYTSDYKKWEGAGRTQPYGMQAAWEPPKNRFEGQTTFQSDYQKNPIPMRHSFKPDDRPRMSDAPFEDSTNHRSDYIKHPMPQKFQRPREEYKPSGAQFEGLTTFKRDYKGAHGEPTHSFKPEGRPFQSDARFDDDTTNRSDFKKWQMERPYVHAHEPYQKPAGEMHMDTTHNSTYKQLPIDRVVAMKPTSAKQASAPFEGRTMYNSEFIKKNAERAQPNRQPDYVPNQAAFQGDSTYKGHYKPHALQPTHSFRPDNRAFQSDAHMEDRTSYRQDYVPQPFQVCEAGGIDQPSSKFKFLEYDNRGHRLYTNVQTSITPLQPRSPMQSQQRLGLSVA